MVNMIVILDKAADEDRIQDLLDILLNRFKESANLVASTKDVNYVTKKSLQKKYKEFIKTTPKDFLKEYNIDSFEKYAEEYWNVIGFVGDDPIVRYNPEALFEYFEISDIYKKSDVDDFDIVSDIDYILDKDGTLYELEDINSAPIGFVKILQRCDCSDYIITVNGLD